MQSLPGCAISAAVSGHVADGYQQDVKEVIDLLEASPTPKARLISGPRHAINFAGRMDKRALVYMGVFDRCALSWATWIWRDSRGGSGNCQNMFLGVFGVVSD